jgi:hypothetical protein
LLARWFCSQSHWQQYWKVEYGKFHTSKSAKRKPEAKVEDVYDANKAEKDAVAKWGPPPSIERVQSVIMERNERKEQDMVEKFGPPPSITEVLEQQQKQQQQQPQQPPVQPEQQQQVGEKLGERQESQEQNQTVPAPSLSTTTEEEKNTTLDNDPNSPPQLSFSP